MNTIYLYADGPPEMQKKPLPHKKKGRGKTIDWKRIFEFAISQKQNRVWKNEKQGKTTGAGGLSDEERAVFERILGASRPV